MLANVSKRQQTSAKQADSDSDNDSVSEIDI